MDQENRVLEFKDIFGTDEKENILLFTDATLRTEDGREFDVHRVVLARQNNYFYELFSSLEGREKKEFAIAGISGESLSDVLIYLYTGRIKMTKLNVADVVVAADYLHVDAVSKTINRGIRNFVDLDNCVDLLSHADRTNNANIFNAALKITQSHFASVVDKHSKTSLAQLPMELFSRILRCKSLSTFGEKSVWLAIVDWVQKDLQDRMSCVPLLLTYLARNETDETLAEEIMNHGIVKNNLFCRFLDYKQSGTCFSFLQNYLRTQREHSLDYRMPSKLYMVIKEVFEDNAHHYWIYVTYDENLNLWRKITKVDGFCRYVVPMGNTLYIFVRQNDWRCLKLDINENKFLQEVSFRQSSLTISVAKLDGCIYVFNDFSTHLRKVAVFDQEGDLSANDISHCNLHSPTIACVSGKMYAVGRLPIPDSGLIFKVYDGESHTWLILDSPPDIVLALVFIAYHEILFLIGIPAAGREKQVKIYDPYSSTWRRVQDLAIPWDEPAAVVWMDDIYVYDAEKIEGTHLVWNEPQECWDAIDGSHPVKGILKQAGDHRIRGIDDVETIRILWKGNQRPDAELERFDLNDFD